MPSHSLLVVDQSGVQWIVWGNQAIGAVYETTFGASTTTVSIPSATSYALTADSNNIYVMGYDYTPPVSIGSSPLGVASSDGGTLPTVANNVMWSPSFGTDGTSLYFVSSDGNLVQSPIETPPPLSSAQVILAPKVTSMVTGSYDGDILYANGAVYYSIPAKGIYRVAIP
jgi:hypothetical protein